MAQASIRGFPRDKRTRLPNLKEKVKKKIRTLHIRAPLVIIGSSGTGRKTLAHRFANMNQGVFHEAVPVAYFYSAFWQGIIPPGESVIKNYNNPYRRFTLRLDVYIIPQPEELPPLTTVHWESWEEFCCAIFAFDVRNSTSFHATYLYLNIFRQNSYHLPSQIFLVGNKSDRRSEPPGPPNDPGEREVQEATASMEAEHMGGHYFECSAKNNTDVFPLLREILYSAVDQPYLYPEPF